MLNTVFLTVGVTIENSAAVRATNAVNVIDTLGGDIGISLIAAAGVDVNCVVALSNVNVIWTGGAHTADNANIVKRGKDWHHAGDFALSENLINNFRFGNAAMRLRDLNIIYHDRVGAQRGNVLLDLNAGKGVINRLGSRLGSFGSGGGLYIRRLSVAIFDIFCLVPAGGKRHDER